MTGTLTALWLDRYWCNASSRTHPAPFAARRPRLVPTSHHVIAALWLERDDSVPYRIEHLGSDVGKAAKIVSTHEPPDEVPSLNNCARLVGAESQVRHEYRLRNMVDVSEPAAWRW